MGRHGEPDRDLARSAQGGLSQPRPGAPPVRLGRGVVCDVVVCDRPRRLRVRRRRRRGGGHRGPGAPASRGARGTLRRPAGRPALAPGGAALEHPRHHRRPRRGRPRRCGRGADLVRVRPRRRVHRGRLAVRPRGGRPGAAARPHAAGALRSECHPQCHGQPRVPRRLAAHRPPAGRRLGADRLRRRRSGRWHEPARAGDPAPGPAPRLRRRGRGGRRPAADGRRLPGPAHGPAAAPARRVPDAAGPRRGSRGRADRDRRPGPSRPAERERRLRQRRVGSRRLGRRWRARGAAAAGASSSAGSSSEA